MVANDHFLYLIKLKDFNIALKIIFIPQIALGCVKICIDVWQQVVE